MCRVTEMEQFNYYECGICEHLHPWIFDGDCRDNKNRFGYDEIENDAIIASWDERRKETVSIFI